MSSASCSAEPPHTALLNQTRWKLQEAKHLEQASLVASSQGGFPHAARQQLAVAEAHKAVVGAGVCTAGDVDLLLGLQVDVYPGQGLPSGLPAVWPISCMQCWAHLVQPA